MMGRTLTFGSKIGMGTAALATALLLTAAYGLHTIGVFADDLANAIGKTARKQQLAGVLSTAASDMAAGQRGMILFTYAKDPVRAAAGDQLFQESRARVQQVLAELRPMAITGRGKQLMAQIDETMSAWVAAYPEVRRLAQSGDPDGAVRVLS